MTFQQLRYIIAIADTTSFAEAASTCGVTQPTLSAMVRKLELELDATLFDRNKKPVGTTAIGTLVIEKARQVLAQAEEIPALISEASHATTGTVSIGILPTIAPYLLPAFLGQFSLAHPGIHLVIQELKTAQIVRALERRALDVGIVAMPHAMLSDLATFTIFEEEFYAYAKTPPTKKYVLAEDIDPNELWVLEEGHCFGDQVLQLCELSRASTKIEYASGSLDTLRRMVDAQGGITVLPELALSTLSEEQHLRVRPFAAPAPKRTIALVSRKDFIRSHMRQLLLDELRVFGKKSATEIA